MRFLSFLCVVFVIGVVVLWVRPTWLRRWQAEQQIPLPVPSVRWVQPGDETDLVSDPTGLIVEASTFARQSATSNQSGYIPPDDETIHAFEKMSYELNR